MSTFPRATGLGGLIACSLLTVSCAITPKPIAAPVTALRWDAGSASYDDVVAAARSLAPTYRYDILEAADDRLILASVKLYGAELDDNCIYPIINVRTGGRMHTFGTWQLELYRSLYYRGRVDGNVLLEISHADYGVRVRSNCRALTQLGIQPAESRGVHEKELVEAIRNQLPVPSAGASVPPAKRDTSEEAAIEPSLTPADDTSGDCDLDLELRKLGRLHTDGLLTDKEFAELKEKLLARCG